MKKKIKNKKVVKKVSKKSKASPKKKSPSPLKKKTPSPRKIGKKNSLKKAPCLEQLGKYEWIVGKGCHELIKRSPSPKKQSPKKKSPKKKISVIPLLVRSSTNQSHQLRAVSCQTIES